MDLIILAAGEGRRFSTSSPKQFLEVRNLETLFLNVYKWFDLKFLGIENIFLVLPEIDFDKHSKRYKDFFDLTTVKGGKSRGESVFNALKHSKSKNIIIHDGARPFFTKKLIINMFKNFNNKALIPITLITDTIKTKNNDLLKTLDRNDYFLVQTPQFFNTELIRSAYEKNKDVNFDDSQLIEEYCQIDVIEGEWNNIKITTQSQNMLIDFLMENDPYYHEAFKKYKRSNDKDR